MSVAALERAAIGVDAGGTGTKAGIVAPSGNVLLRIERPTDRTAATKGVIAVVEDLLERAQGAGARIDAIGVGAAGFVDFATGSITFSPNLTFDDPHVAAALAQRCDLPVVVDNDANAAVVGERAFGAARGLDHVVMLTVGTGIGSGLIVNGSVIRGATGAGAELGHMVIDPTGPRCSCGLRGCLEQFASGSAIARMAKEAAAEDPSSSIAAFAVGRPITAEDVSRAARELDETARRVLRRAGKALGIGLSNIVNVFDPEVIVLGGGAAGAGEAFLGAARDTLAQMMSAQRRRAMRLDVGRLGGNAGIVGAAAMALAELPKV